MQLQLRVVALQRPHFDYACFFEHHQSQSVILDIVCVLKHAGNRAHNINHIVALVIYCVHFSARPCKITSQTMPNHVVDRLWVRLITNFKHVVLGDLIIETSSCCLQIVQRVSHIAFCCKDQRFKTSLVTVERLQSYDVLEALENLLIFEFGESDDCTTGLDRLYQLAAVIAS